MAVYRNGVVLNVKSLRKTNQSSAVYKRQMEYGVLTVINHNFAYNRITEMRVSFSILEK